jgi:hypothetical protein
VSESVCVKVSIKVSRFALAWNRTNAIRVSGFTRSSYESMWDRQEDVNAR